MSEVQSLSHKKTSKRKRLDADIGHNTAMENDSIKKSQEFWFDDGNFIFEVEDTRYQVHRSVLSRHSSGFFDMLGLLQEETTTAGGEEDGQVVRLRDAKKDWDHVLDIIYDSYK